MYQLSGSAVIRWSNVQASGKNYRFPQSFDMNCPACGKQVNFVSEAPLADQNRQATSATARCTRCRETISVWTIISSEEARVYVLPGPDSKNPMEGTEIMPESMQRAYQSTVAAFNAGIWDATLVSGRRTLEALVQHLAPDPDARAPLAKQLERLSDNEQVDLAAPLITLSHAVRQGGNLGAHFEFERAADRQIAALTLEMIEYFLWYIYVLPDKIEDLDRKIEGQDEQEGAEGGSDREDG
jgi:hypothetical protein